MTTTETKTKNDNGLADMVKRIADDIHEGGFEPAEEGSNPALDYLDDALDIQWVTQGGLTFIGARVLVAFGGPNIWIDTAKQKVEGFWLPSVGRMYGSTQPRKKSKDIGGVITPKRHTIKIRWA